MRILITKESILNAPKGHEPHYTGTGLHRNWKKQPKGGRNAQRRRAINEG